MSVAVLEKEQDWARHQTGRNNGAVHSGIYYRPGSLKAELCRVGNQKLLEFCKDYGGLIRGYQERMKLLDMFRFVSLLRYWLHCTGAGSNGPKESA